MIHIVNGLHDHNEYFIFREDNKEVKIDVSGGYIKADHILNPKERKYINEIILMRDNWESPEDEELQAIYNLAEQGFTDYYISDKLNISFNYTVQMTTEFWRKRMEKQQKLKKPSYYEKRTIHRQFIQDYYNLRNNIFILCERYARSKWCLLASFLRP